MSKKVRGTKSDWVKCSPSGCLVSRTDLVRRDVPVSPADETDLDPRVSGAGLGYVGEDGYLRAVVYSHKVDVEKPKLPQSTQQELVHLSPTTMALCKLCVGRPVLISCVKTNRAVVGTAWPGPPLSLTSVGLCEGLRVNCGADPGAIVLVQPLLGPFLPLAELHLEPRKYMEFQKTRCFQDYCRQQLGLQILIPGNSIQLAYYGKPCVLTVGQTCGVDGRTQTNRCPEENILAKSSLVEEQTQGSEENTTLPGAMGKLTLEDGHLNAKSEPTFAENKTDCFSHRDPLVQNLEMTYEERLCEQVNTNDSSAKCEEFDGSAQQNTDGTKEEMIQRKTHGPFYYVTSETKLVIDAGGDRATKDDGQEGMSYDMIGGLSRELSIIRDMVELPLTCPEAFRSLGVGPPSGVLLFGPPGTGKTMVARTLAAEIGATFITINGPEVLCKFYGETESRLRDIFQQAEDRAPCIIFIDELDALCPRRDKIQSELEKRVVATLLTLMDGIRLPGQVVVLAATNRPGAVDPALRRPGRFDREVEIPIPNAVQRAEILSCLLRKMPHTLSPDNIASIADSAHGYVGADLTAVCKEAGLQAFRRYTERVKVDEYTETAGGDSSLAQTVQVSLEDFVFALREVKPSAMREVMIDVPRVHWSDIGGQAVIKQKLQQAVQWPLQNPEAFQRMGIQPPHGILMYGPPGCSKTLIARALATESGLNFIAVKGPELFSKWVGESELAVREVFRKARAAAPSIVFFDEIDALAVSRGSSGGANSVADRVLAQLLTEINGVDRLGDVTIVAATNRPDMIDKALLRPGRIDRILYIPLPDADTRREILKIQFQTMPVSPDLDVDWLVQKTQNYSGAEVVAVCQEAALSALTEDIKAQSVLGRHFHQALQAVCARIGPEMIRFYQQYQQNSGLHCI
ncbi:PREDICTED: LOW QUALITY PROTEIN: spermatogenesis-associated protein 5-like [Branchiostoma belcheri]|uniref:LOW QUALITY PROTEIN: spermatogenesis-associated protein 5-like n=1 Tax=Branchiostoma belcheri TaxID=7741 RepID=A0A6P4Z480_BRABE|nr:PREDICTED: LOW QUALITY PROTEIN: spermatogenesis-associated protein 5-like [Branchiostoma belcheri]